MRRENFNVRHPLFRPLWLRALLVAIVSLWTLFEIALGQPLYALITAPAAAYLFHQFFWVFDPRDYEREDPET